jgi:hypothetical protein
MLEQNWYMGTPHPEGDLVQPMNPNDVRFLLDEPDLVPVTAGDLRLLSPGTGSRAGMFARAHVSSGHPRGRCVAPPKPQGSPRTRPNRDISEHLAQVAEITVRWRTRRYS